MDDTTTPKPRPNYSRPTKFPAAISIMTTAEQRAEVDDVAEREGGLAAGVRVLLDHGLDLDAALLSDPALGPDIDRLARESGVVRAEAIKILLRFAVDESARRVRRNFDLAHRVGEAFGELGITVDGVEVSGISLTAEG